MAQAGILQSYKRLTNLDGDAEVLLRRQREITVPRRGNDRVKRLPRNEVLNQTFQIGLIAHEMREVRMVQSREHLPFRGRCRAVRVRLAIPDLQNDKIFDAVMHRAPYFVAARELPSPRTFLNRVRRILPLDALVKFPAHFTPLPCLAGKNRSSAEQGAWRGKGAARYGRNP